MAILLWGAGSQRRGVRGTLAQACFVYSLGANRVGPSVAPAVCGANWDYPPCPRPQALIRVGSALCVFAIISGSGKTARCARPGAQTFAVCRPLNPADLACACVRPCADFPMSEPGALILSTATGLNTSTATNRGVALATPIRQLGDFDLAEEALHDAFAAAAEQWPASRLPAHRGGGLFGRPLLQGHRRGAAALVLRRGAGRHCPPRGCAGEHGER